MEDRIWLKKLRRDFKSGGRTLGNRKTSICGRKEKFRRRRATVGPSTPLVKPRGRPRHREMENIESTYFVGARATLDAAERERPVSVAADCSKRASGRLA